VSDEPSEVQQGAAAAATDAAAVLAHDDALVDEMDEESFPGSDPPSTWAGHDRPSQG
jgi:hypothetical protein